MFAGPQGHIHLWSPSWLGWGQEGVGTSPMLPSELWWAEISSTIKVMKSQISASVTSPMGEDIYSGGGEWTKRIINSGLTPGHVTTSLSPSFPVCKSTCVQHPHWEDLK